MPRPPLPLNYVTQTGTLFENFQNPADWALSGGGTKIADTDNFRVGTQGLLVSTNVAVAVANTVTKTIDMDMSTHNRDTSFWIWLPDDYLVHFKSVNVYLSSSTTVATSFRYGLLTDDLQAGWNKIRIPRSAWIVTGAESWANRMVRLRFRLEGVAGLNTHATLDDFRIDVASEPRVVITFDDGHITAYDEGFTYMDSKGLRGTQYVISGFENAVDYQTPAHFQTMYDNGWCLGVHTHNHLNLSTLTTDEIYYELRTCRQYLQSQGWTRGMGHVAYPFGGTNATVRHVMSELGMETGRTTVRATQTSPWPMNSLKGYSVSNTDSLAAVKGWVDAAITDGQTCVLVFHRLVAVPTVATEWQISDFQSLINYIIARRIPVVTMDEWYEGQANPRYRSLPLSRSTV